MSFMKGRQRTNKGREAWLPESLSHSSTAANIISGHFRGWKDFFFLADLVQEYQTQGHAVGNIYKKLLSVHLNIHLTPPESASQDLDLVTSNIHTI